MRTADVIAFFKSQAALARALGIRQQSVADWGEVVPALRQLQIERITEGQLRADADVFGQPEQAPSLRAGDGSAP